MKHRILFCASVAAFALLAAQPGLAQVVPPPYPGTMYPGDGALPPYEIVTIVRSTGLDPIGRPVRQGPAYALRAVDPAGEEVRVIVNAYMGRIVKVIPLSEPRYAMPLMRPPFGRPPRPMAMVPDGEFDDFAPTGRGAGALPAGPAASAPHGPAAQAGPPLPRPRPKVASNESPTTGAPPLAGPYDYE
ncbi:MAG: hypothetical protein ACJ8FA_13000 [Xanthobacteraceae bacterium]